VESPIDGGLLLVVPTYNELGNIEQLVDRLSDARRRRPFDVLILDDGSPDGTGDRVRQLAAERPWLQLVERDGPQGLGSAYRAGFAWARVRGYSRVGEMDADLSHDPAVVPTLEGAVADGADLALGSRYVAGGGSEGWSLARRLLSKGANLFARTLLRLPTRDVTGGFRVYSGRAIDMVLEHGTECDGYGFQVESVHILTRNDMRIVEVPITFRERKIGSSKMSNKVVWEAARRCVRLAFTDSANGGTARPPVRSSVAATVTPEVTDERA
jgi:dolichol-phosphate mannosyltransferase